MTDYGPPIEIIAKRARRANQGGKGKRGGPASSNSHSKSKTDAKLLVEQAMSYGWLNGKRLPRKAR